MNNAKHNITVIIATTALKERRSSILKAINCILNQSEVNALPLLIVNGDRFDSDLNEELKNRSDIKYLYQREGDFSEAIYYGVKNVNTPYFSFLDDDDIYLDNALSIRLQPMLKDKDVGLTVTAGYRHGIGKEYMLPFDEEEFALDPVAALLKSPWLSSCSGLYRKSLLDVSIFDHNYRNTQWTYLAFIIANITKIAFINKPTFLINYTESSSSSSPFTEVCRSRIMHEISQSKISNEQKKKFLDKKYAAYHLASEMYLQNKDLVKAWKYHMLCLINIRGMKYLSYTYHLCRFSIFSQDRDGSV